jgi:hypothetical protein
VKTLNLARTAAFLIPGLVITFMPQDHSARLGLLSLMGFAAAYWMLPLLVLLPRPETTLRGRIASLNSASPLSMRLGAFALTVAAPIALANPQHQVFVGLVAIWGLALAINEAGMWRKAKDSKQARSSHLITAVLSIGIAAILVALPLNDRNAVGFFGAYLVIMAIHLGIDALSPATKASPDQKLQ